MTQRTTGILSMIAASTIWGLSSLLYHALRHVPAAEVLAHRTLWSLVLFAAVLVWQRRMAALPRSLRGPHLRRIVLAALLVSLNWGVFIWSVQHGHAVEASLGYYIYPLIAVVLGVLMFRERLAPLQQAAAGLAGAAVVLLTWGLGAAPWISLTLAATFAAYGALKKALPLDPVLSVAAEVAVLTPLALLWLALVHMDGGGTGGHFGTDAWTSLLLVLCGPVTAVPLILFAQASRTVEMASVGLIGYLNPTLQAFCAVALFGEPFTRWHGIAFAMIWTALAIYSVSASGQRAGRRA